MEDKKRTSLFVRILLPLTFTMSLCWIILLFILGRASYHELHEILDQQMIQTAQMLTVPMDHMNLPELRFSGKDDEDDDDQEYMIHFVVWNQGQQILFADRRGDLLPRPFDKNGFFEITNKESHYRIYNYHNKKTGLSASAGYPASVKNEMISEIVEKFWWPWLLGLLSLVGVAILSLWWGLKPLRQLQKELKTRNPRHLEKFTTTVPFEIQNLKNELNRLIDQIRNQLEKERRFTADAAHELKTPLAAIRVQTEILSMDLSDRDLQVQTEKIMQGVDRTNRLVDQLLTLSRLDETQLKKQKHTLDLVRIFLRQKENLQGLIADKNAHITIKENGSFHLDGEEFLLEILFKNLIENSLKYGGKDVHISFTVNADNFSIEDNGAGVSPEKLQRLKERFYRPEGQAESGSGLGLSIVEKIAELHDLEMQVTSDSKLKKGFKVLFQKAN